MGFLDGVSDLTLSNDFYGITEELLQRLSYPCSYGKSLNKLAVTDGILNIVIADSLSYEMSLQGIRLPSDISRRVKTVDSIQRKLQRKPDARFQSVFNDLLSLRLVVESYPTSYPSYFRVVDMTNGKVVDDGYRAVHLYYKKDNYHYPIEVQLWSKGDCVFNNWTHTLGYKILDSEVLSNLYKLYKSGKISSEEDYMKYVGGLLL